MKSIKAAGWIVLAIVAVSSAPARGQEEDLPPDQALKQALYDMQQRPVYRARPLARALDIIEDHEDLTPVFVEGMLTQMKDLPGLRADIREDVVRSTARRETLKKTLVAKCKELAAKEATEPDKNFVVNLILILRELTNLQEAGERQQVTDLFLDLLDSASFQVRYQAEDTLGQFWEKRGAGEEVSEQCREVNTALVGLLSTEIQPPEVYAIGGSLIRINGLPLPTGRNPYTKKPEPVEITNVSIDDARAYIEKWSQGAGAKYLLPPEKRKPLHIYSTYRRAGKEDMRLEARKVLQELKPMVVVDAILKDLRAEGLDAVTRDDLPRILSAITSVKLDLEGAEQPGDIEIALRKWRAEFYDYLSTEKDPRVRDYILGKLMTAIQLAQVGQATLQDIENWQWVCIKNFDKPADLPENLPEEVLRLLRAPLVKKELLADAIKVIESKEQDLGTKILRIYQVQQRLVQTADDRRLARLFLRQFTTVLLEERQRRVIAQLRDLLRDITGYPMGPIEDYSMQDRRRMVEEWLKLVEGEQS
jgi:hypothetical protein